MHTHNLCGFPSGYFYVKNGMSNKFLDVCLASTEPGADVITFHLKKLKEGHIDSQLWKHEAGYLINKLSGMCLDIDGGRLIQTSRVCQSPRKPSHASHHQRWVYTSDNKIASMSNQDMVLDIEGGCKEDFANITINPRKSQLQDHENQQWVFIPRDLVVAMLH